MLVCLRCRSLLTRSVRWPSHSSKWRVPLTTFIAPEDSGLRIEKSTGETAFFGRSAEQACRASLDGEARGGCPLYDSFDSWRLKLCLQQPSVAALGHLPNHEPYCFQLDTAWPASCPCMTQRRTSCKWRSHSWQSC